jgi:hypothetical protein
MWGQETEIVENRGPDVSEKKLALIHRVLVPDHDYPREYAILVTNLRSIFILQPKTRRNFVLRYETMIGTALVTDVNPKTLEDYEQTSIETLASDIANQSVPHEDIISLTMQVSKPSWRRRDFFVKMVMNKQKEVFQVYNFEMRFRKGMNKEATIKFYAVPLGAYFKPRRQVQNRETILRDYSRDILEIYRGILPSRVIQGQ